MLDISFWKGALERLIKTGAQTLAASVTVGTSILGIDWKAALGLTATAMVASLLTSLGSASFVAGTPTTSASSITSGTISGVDISGVPAVPGDNDPEHAGPTDDVLAAAEEYTPTHAADDSPSVVPDGEGAATVQS